MNSVNLLSAVTSPTTSPTRTRTVGAWAVNFENAFNISVIKKNVSLFIQSDQEENKSEQALQLIGHVVAEFYANKRSMHRRGLKRYLIQNHRYLINCRRWNYNCAFYYYFQIMEDIYKINEQHFTFVRVGNLLALLP
jgi:hypothetical protein